MTAPSTEAVVIDGQALPAVLSILKNLHPPEKLIHVGAGNGLGPLSVWKNWGLNEAVVIDADEARLGWVKDIPEATPCAAVLSDTSSTIQYFRTSNSDEDGLLSPDVIRKAWPNISELEMQTRTASTLDQFADSPQNDLSKGVNTWLFIDCFPALDILRGGNNILPRTNIVCARVAELSENAVSRQLRAEALKDYLTPAGFRLIGYVSGNNPYIGYALFGRDPAGLVATESKARLEVLAQLDIEVKAKNEALAQLEAISKEKSALDVALETESRAKREALERLDSELIVKNEALAHCEVLDREKVALERALETESQAKRDALEQCESEMRGKKEALAHCEVLDKEKVALETALEIATNARAEATGQREALVTEMSALKAQLELQSTAVQEAIKQRDAEAKAKAEANSLREALAKEKADLQLANEGYRKDKVVFEKDKQTLNAKMEQLQAENRELLQRQQMLREELIKSEAQIDLIKDLLLREEGI